MAFGDGKGITVVVREEILQTNSDLMKVTNALYFLGFGFGVRNGR